MEIQLRNRVSKIIKYLLGDIIVFGILLAAILMIDIPLSQQPIWVSLFPVLILIGVVVFEWFRSIRFYYDYFVCTQGNSLSLDPESKLVTINSLKKGMQQTLNYNKVILHTHIKNKPPFENPNRIDDKIENFLIAKGNNRYSNIWYIELTTSIKKPVIITALMIRKNKLKIEIDHVSYERNPLIVNGS